MNRVRLLVPVLLLQAAACAEPQPQTPLIAIGERVHIPHNPSA
jgi:hypothetical protein